MNIRSVKADPVVLPAQTVTPQTAKPVQTEAADDSFTPAQNAQLVQMLQQQPDIRPDAVERAKSLAADPNYPSASTISNLAKLFINNSAED